MKTLLFNTLIVLFYLPLLTQAQVDSLKLIWETDTVLKTVESVQFYPQENIVFASCINGKPTDKDNNGYISKISLDGSIKELKWITGLDAPKGMGIFDGKLFVTNIDQLVIIDIAKNQIEQKVQVDGAQFLNDITISEAEIVLISDMFTNTIYQYQDNKVAIFIQDKALNHPNGLFCEKDTLYVGSRNALLKVNINTKEFETHIENTGSIDGLKKISKNEFLISNWKSNVIYLTPSAKSTILDTEDDGFNAADFEFIAKRNYVIVPTFFANRLMCYRFINEK